MRAQPSLPPLSGPAARTLRHWGVGTHRGWCPGRTACFNCQPVYHKMGGPLRLRAPLAKAAAALLLARGAVTEALRPAVLRLSSFTGTRGLGPEAAPAWAACLRPAAGRLVRHRGAPPAGGLCCAPHSGGGTKVTLGPPPGLELWLKSDRWKSSNVVDFGQVIFGNPFRTQNYRILPARGDRLTRL